MTIKTYARRDSVTSILRKRGIPSGQYNDWIIKNDNGTFSIREQDQTPPWEDVSNNIGSTTGICQKRYGKDTPCDCILCRPAAEPKTKKSTKAEAPKAGKETRRTVSSAAREHILAGHDNKKVWELLKEEFNLDDSKKYYPSWYRSEMKRKAAN